MSVHSTTIPTSLRSLLRLEASWDSSRHENIFLNRITPSNEHVFITLTTAIQVYQSAAVQVGFTSHVCLTDNRGR